MSEKLDSFNKILIATGQINYMASIVNEVNEQMKMLPDTKGYHKGGIKSKDDLLDDVVIRLRSIMEDMGNLIDASDCFCAIDTRVTKVPFEIIIHNMDEVDNYYEDDAIEN